MDNKTLDQLINQAIVDILSDYLVHKITQPSKKMLVLFTGAICGLQDALSSLEQLKQSDYCFTAIFSKAAQSVLTTQLTDITERLELSSSNIIYEDDDIDVFDLLKDYNILLIPTLTANTTAKMACGINDCLSTRILFQAMSLGMRIIAAIDGCCPHNKERLARGFNATEPFKQQLSRNIEVLKSYGVTFSAAKKLADKILRIPSAATINLSTQPKYSNDAKNIYNKRVFARQDAVIYSEPILRVTSNVLITPLAMDELSRRCISIIRE